jgi:hypothetical protein
MLGKEPSNVQAQLYDKWPNFRGISSTAQDSAIAESAFVLAIRSGFADDKVLVLAPPTQEKWLLEQFSAFVDTIFERAKLASDPDTVARTVKGYSKLFHKVVLTGRLLQLHREPQYWVSFGFTSTDKVVPAWVTRRILTVE